MLNIIKSEFYKHYMVSLKNALIGSLFFLIIHLFANVEFIRKHAEDFSFDVTNVFLIILMILNIMYQMLKYLL